MKNDRNSGSTYQSPACWWAMIAEKLTLPDMRSTGIETQPHRDLVRDHLGAGAEAAEQGILAVGRPAGERDPVHAEGADGEHEEKPDGEIGHHHGHPPVMDEAAERSERKVEVHRQRRGKGNHPGQQERGNERQSWGQEEEDPVGFGRKRFLLEDVLDAIGRGLEEAGPSDPVGAAPVLHPGAHLAFHEREQRDADHDDGEDEEHLEDAEEEKALHLGCHRAAPTPAPPASTRPVNPRSA